jgi:hypothetical protein
MPGGPVGSWGRIGQSACALSCTQVSAILAAYLYLFSWARNKRHKGDRITVSLCEVCCLARPSPKSRHIPRFQSLPSEPVRLSPSRTGRATRLSANATFLRVLDRGASRAYGLDWWAGLLDGGVSRRGQYTLASTARLQSRCVMPRRSGERERKGIRSRSAFQPYLLLAVRFSTFPPPPAPTPQCPGH